MKSFRVRRLALAVLAAALVGGGLLSSRGETHSRAAPPDVRPAEIEQQFAIETVADSLDTVWDMKWAPDGEMWFTERAGRVSRLDVSTGRVTVVGTVPDVLESGEAGLMGFAFHPDFPREPWVYFAHSFAPAGAEATGLGRFGRGGGRTIRNRLVRMRYRDGRLEGLETLVDSFRGRGNHNGAALAVGSDRMIYMTMGEAGDPALSQDSTLINGKILRFALDGKPAPGNPFGSAVWSWGHRNPQGLVFHPTTGTLYSAEHGGGAEDEVNLIERGKNYGWPEIEGMCNQPREEDRCASGRFTHPIWATSPSTVGMSGIDIYLSDAIPGWRGSLLVTAMRGASLFRLRLSDDGRSVLQSERLYQRQFGRLRDVLVGPDGTVYLATSNLDGRGQPEGGDDRIVRVSAGSGKREAASGKRQASW